jgi:hypothetical protein
MIISLHYQSGKEDGLTGPWHLATPLAGYLRSGAHAGIHRAVLVAV